MATIPVDELRIIRQFGPHLSVMAGQRVSTSVEPDALVTGTAMPLAEKYHGVWVCTNDFRSYRRVNYVEQGKIILDQKLPADHSFKAGEDVWLVDAGPGDTVECPTITDKQLP